MQELKFDPAKLDQLPSEIKPEMCEAWNAFHFLTEDWSVDRREDAWFDLIQAIRPGTDQIVFTADDWARVIAAIRGGRGATALPAGAIRGDGSACLPEAAATETEVAQ